MKDSRYWAKPITPRRAAGLSAAVFAILALVIWSGGRQYLYERLVYPLEFKVRIFLHRSAGLDPRIKIYALDRTSTVALGSESVPIDVWLAIFARLKNVRPTATLLDKMLFLPISRDPGEVTRFGEAVAAAGPVFAAAVVNPTPIAGYPEVALSDPRYAFRSASGRASHVYGPPPALLSYFRGVGHINYDDERSGFIEPLRRVDEAHAVPFLGLSVLGGPRVDASSGKLTIAGHEISVDSTGQALIDYPDPEAFRRRTARFIDLLPDPRTGKPQDRIQPGDIVILLTRYSDAAAVKLTPVGRLPSGFITAGAANAALTGGWLRPVGGELLFTALFCAVGAALAYALSPLSFCLALASLVLALAILGEWGLCGPQLLLPWLIPALGASLAGLAVFVEKMRVAERRAGALRFSLEGMVGPAKLRQILAQPASLHLEPTSQIVTVMFVDIVGFSLAAEQATPFETFRELRQLLGLVSEIIHDCGGIIDRSLGDGLLCFFGYRYSGDAAAPPEDHAERALECALRIQLECARHALATAGEHSPVFPLRIGVNTGEVYVGDLGGVQRIDFTIIGHGVNYAQRLESACENFLVMCGANTVAQLAADHPYRRDLLKKLVPIKHRKDPEEAFELDPFRGEPELRRNAQQRYQRHARLSRNEERFTVAPHQLISLSCAGRPGVLLDYSASGLSARLTECYGKGVQLRLSLSLDNASLTEELASAGMSVLVAEVRWSRVDGDGFRHGLLIKNLSDEQRRWLMRRLAGEKTHAALSA